MRSRRAAAVTVAAALVLAGCATRPTPQPAAPHRHLPAAEPAVAPPLSRAPAGRVVRIGAAPEGVVADGRTGRVAVGTRDPNALTIVDAATAAVTVRVPLPGHLRHLQLAAPGGPVLVPDEDSGRLLLVNLPDGRVSATIPTGASPHDATRAANGTVFAANEAGHSLAAIRDGKVVHVFTEPPQPAGLAPVGNQVAMVDVADDMLRFYDADRLVQTAQLPAGDGPTHVVADRRGRFVVADTRGNAVLTFTGGAHPRELSRLALPGTPYGIAADPVRDWVWLTLTARNEVVAVDTSTPVPRIRARLPTVRQPNTVAVDPATGALWITGTANGELEMIARPQ